MTRRYEAGPALVVGGALLLLIALFLPFYAPGRTAWRAFELVDLLLAGLALAAGLLAADALRPGPAQLERRWLAPVTAGAVLLVVAALLDPPPAARGGDPQTGLWLALGAVGLIGLGALLTFARISVAVDVRGRDPRQRVAAVDARGTGTGTGTGAGSGEPARDGSGITQPFGAVTRAPVEPAPVRRLAPRGPSGEGPASASRVGGSGGARAAPHPLRSPLPGSEPVPAPPSGSPLPSASPDPAAPTPAGSAPAGAAPQPGSSASAPQPGSSASAPPTPAGPPSPPPAET